MLLAGQHIDQLIDNGLLVSGNPDEDHLGPALMNIGRRSGRGVEDGGHMKGTPSIME
ncbi:MAG: hypothetical protein U5R48_12455 [Gammaproteobacteria bacterium]|nr:hypothetical protein [Gammaproteobacteria bacterium]